MTTEIILDILLSAIVLYIYHSDCKASNPQVLEFALATVGPAESYDYGCIAVAPTEPEWVLDADADESLLADADKLIDGNTEKPYADVAAPLYTLEQLQGTSVKALRLMAKAIGVKGASRKSKAELACGLAAYYSIIG